jgi:hypothetical protein
MPTPWRQSSQPTPHLRSRDRCNYGTRCRDYVPSAVIAGAVRVAAGDCQEPVCVAAVLRDVAGAPVELRVRGCGRYAEGFVVQPAYRPNDCDEISHNTGGVADRHGPIRQPPRSDSSAKHAAAADDSQHS